MKEENIINCYWLVETWFHSSKGGGGAQQFYWKQGLGGVLSLVGSKNPFWAMESRILLALYF